MVNSPSLLFTHSGLITRKKNPERVCEREGRETHESYAGEGIVNCHLVPATRPFLFLALRSSSWNRMPEKGVEEGNKKERDLSYDRSLSNDMTRSLFLFIPFLTHSFPFPLSQLTPPFGHHMLVPQVKELSRKEWWWKGHVIKGAESSLDMLREHFLSC